MKSVNFGSLQEGDVFTYGNVEYKKVKKVKISCCKFVNCVGTVNPGQKTGLRDGQVVEIKEETEE